MGNGTSHIMLIGPRRAGKTTVGRLLADHAGLPWIDTDDVVAARCGEALAVWIPKHGWPAFRMMEQRVLEDVLNGPRSVISAGGGVILHGDLHARMRARAYIVYLRVHADILATRAQLDSRPTDRPTLSGLDPVTEAYATFADRDDAYRALCHAMVDAEGDANVVATRALAVTMSQQ